MLIKVCHKIGNIFWVDNKGLIEITCKHLHFYREKNRKKCGQCYLKIQVNLQVVQKLRWFDYVWQYIKAWIVFKHMLDCTICEFHCSDDNTHHLVVAKNVYKLN